MRVGSNGINVFAGEERHGRPRDLFWPWFGANVSIFGLSYGAFALGFGISFWQGVVVGAVGIVFSNRSTTAAGLRPARAPPAGSAEPAGGGPPRPRGPRAGRLCVLLRRPAGRPRR